MPVLLMTILMSGLGFGLVLPGFLFVAKNLGASSVVATTIIGLFAVGNFIAAPLWGRLSDRFGRKPILIFSLLGQTLSYVLLAFAEDLWLMAIARLLNGVTSGNLSVAMAYVTDITPPEKRAGGMGLIGGAISLGFIVGPALGGVLSGADASQASLFLPSLVAAAICALTAIAGIIFLRESLTDEQRLSHASAAAEESGFAATRRVFRNGALARMVVCGLLVYVAMSQFETVFPIWSEARFGWGPREVGFIFTYLGCLVGFVQGVMVGRLVPRFGEGRLVTFGLLCYPLGLIIMTQAPVWQVMMLGITFTAGGGALFITTMTSLVSGQAGPQERGLVMGVYQSGSWMGRSFGPPLAGLIFDLVGPNGPLYAACVILVPALALVAAIRSRTDEARAPKPL